jgi:hypothetical protein
MKKSPLKSGRLIIAALTALVPLAAAQADDRDPRSYEGTSQQYQDQQLRGSQGPIRSDVDSATPTYSGEDRRQFQSETPGAEGPVRSETESSQTYGSERSLPRDQYHEEMRGAEGPTRSEMDASAARDSRMMMKDCPASSSEKTAPNAYYGESNPFYSEQGRNAFLGKGQWC